MSDEPAILRPRPRRVFDLTPAPSNESSEAPTPAEPANPDLLNPKDVSRNGSIMNLTSSTLFGIYSPTAFEGSRDESSPWGTEAQSPATENVPSTEQHPGPDRYALERARSRLSHGLFRGVILPRALRGALLFAFGIVYGVITVHLHENHWITPVKLENIHYYDSWQYLGFWGLAGVALGNVLPWLDNFFEDSVLDSSKKVKRSSGEGEERTPSWVAVVRSVGAFVGIAFAMVSRFDLILWEPVLTKSSEATPLAVDDAGVRDARTRQPGPVVSHRPHQDRVFPVHDCGIGRDVHRPGIPARDGAIIRGCIHGRVGLE